MKLKYILFIPIIIMWQNAHAQQIHWTYTTTDKHWVENSNLSLNKNDTAHSDIVIYPDQKLQKMEGFGACFNELGWEALLTLSQNKRDEILKTLFLKEAANFTLCRIPVASNDYSLSYYSFNDVPNDFKMRNFNIDRDRYILIPYIKAALKFEPELKIWASPWSPPAWMKVNEHYSMNNGGSDKYASDMGQGRHIGNNATAFKMQDDYLNAYSLYLSKFVQAYQNEGVDIKRLCVQNEIVYAPQWPSCTWRPEDLSYFIGKYLGPRFKSDQIATEIWLGTVNTADPNYTRTVLNNKDAASFIRGIGFQWDAKQQIKVIHNEFSSMPIMQTESECGNGENNWRSAEYTWSLIDHYISNGASSYMYWNMVLDETGRSTWGWVQNALISVNKHTGEIKYNPEFYLMKHLSHFVIPGSYLLNTSAGKNHLAFLDPNGNMVIMIMNSDDKSKSVKITSNGKSVNVNLSPKSINTLTWPLKE